MVALSFVNFYKIDITASKSHCKILQNFSGFNFHEKNCYRIKVTISSSSLGLHQTHLQPGILLLEKIKLCLGFCSQKYSIPGKDKTLFRILFVKIFYPRKRINFVQEDFWQKILLLEKMNKLRRLLTKKFSSWKR